MIKVIQMVYGTKKNQSQYAEFEKKAVDFVRTNNGKYGNAEKAVMLNNDYDFTKVNDQQSALNCMTDTLAAYQVALRGDPKAEVTEDDKTQAKGFILGLSRRGVKLSQLTDAFRAGRGDEAVKRVLGAYKQDDQSNAMSVFYNDAVRANGGDYMNQLADGFKADKHLNTHPAELAADLEDILVGEAEKVAGEDRVYA